MEKNGKRISLLIIVILIAAILVVSAAGIWLFSGYGKNNTEKQENVEKSSAEEQKIEFPYYLIERKIEVNSLFPYTLFNPDCNDEEGEDIACISFTNCSEEYMEFAEFTVILLDGTEYVFKAFDVPSGADMLAFSVDNSSYNMITGCKSIECKAEFTKDISMMEDAVSVSVDETEVTLTNITGEKLTKLIVCYHTLFDGEYFGGKTYQHTAENIESGESITFQAEECYLGKAAVVRIEGDN